MILTKHFLETLGLFKKLFINRIK